MWDLPSKSLLLSVSFPSTLSCLAVSPSEDVVYAGGNDGYICLSLSDILFRTHFRNVYKVVLLETDGRDSDHMRQTKGELEKVHPGLTCGSELPDIVSRYFLDLMQLLACHLTQMGVLCAQDIRMGPLRYLL